MCLPLCKLEIRTTFTLHTITSSNITSSQCQVQSADMPALVARPMLR
jgi:hypothetical protein